MEFLEENILLRAWFDLVMKVNRLLKEAFSILFIRVLFSIYSISFGFFMGFFSKISTSRALRRLQEENLFKVIHDELENGVVNDGLWMKALADSNGDELLAKAKYIKLRLRSFKDEITIENEIQKEAERAIKEADRTKIEADRAKKKFQKDLNKSLREAGKRLRR